SPVINREDIRAVSDYGSTNGQVFGVAPNYNEIRTIPIGNGRWFNEGDNKERRRVGIVGLELLKNVFPGRPAVGATLLLNGIRFDVIGVLAKVGQEGNNGTNGRIFVPVETMRNLFPLKEKNTENAISFINYRPLNKAEHLRSKEEVHQIIARLHGFNPKLDDVFEDWDTVENSQKVGKIFDAMDYFLGVVGLVTLVLGAIGIVNIMLVSVAERTKEIGLRKALGATHRNILTQFFVEGAFLTLLSGGVGLAIMTGFVGVAGAVPTDEGFGTPPLVAFFAGFGVVLLALGGIWVGGFSGGGAGRLWTVC